MNISRTEHSLTKAADDAYTLNALLVTCSASLEAIEGSLPGGETNRDIGAVRRLLREVAAPLVSNCINALELAEREAGQ